jgi:hypothetical protein
VSGRIGGEPNASRCTGGFVGHVTVSLRADPDGSVRVDAAARGALWSRVVTATVFAGLREQMADALPAFDDGRRPFADPVALAGLGARLRDTFFRCSTEN